MAANSTTNMFRINHLYQVDSSLTLRTGPFQNEGCLIIFIITMFYETRVFNVNSLDPRQTSRSALS